MINSQAMFMIVDDYEAVRSVIAAQLHAIGATKIITANNGVEAMEILQRRHVDAVLSDWNMPLMSGLELLRSVRRDTRLYNLPFVLITAESERDRVQEAIACGVSGLLVKPYTTERLNTCIDKAVNWNPRMLSVAETAQSDMSDTQIMRAAQCPTILVVDDTADNLLLLSHLFKDEYRVRIAHKGEKALEICYSDNPPDLVLLDIMMPGMDGFEVARRMREHPNSEHIPVIFVTAMSGNDARLRGLELGAVDFITKPIDPEVLKPRVRNFMRYVQLYKQLQANYDGMLESARLREDVEHITRHDIKGPLAAALYLVQELASDKTMNSTQLEQLRMVEETSLQVLNMVNLSSELYKIETGRFHLDAKPVAIVDILRRIGASSRATFAEKHLTISIDTDVSLGEEIPQAMGDAMLCYSLLNNLIKNACEAAPQRSLVSVMLLNLDPLCVLIENTGTVPAEIRARFFDKYATSGKQDGNGLGTYSANLMAKAQGGFIDLHVSDETNKTTLTVTLQRASAC
jgi:two-component system sensor histidine kinase/response regulator